MSSRHTKPGDCPRQFQGNKGGTTPENLFPAAPRAAFKNSLTWKILKGWKKTSKEFTNCLIFERIKTTASGVPVTKNVWHLSKRTATQRRKFWFSFDQKLRTSRNPTGCFKKLLWQNSQQRVRKIWFSHEDRIKTPALEIRTPQKSIMEKGRRLERRKIPSVCLSLSV